MAFFQEASLFIRAASLGRPLNFLDCAQVKRGFAQAIHRFVHTNLSRTPARSHLESRSPIPATTLGEPVAGYSTDGDDGAPGCAGGGLGSAGLRPAGSLHAGMTPYANAP
jgi:hypothetical protein